MKSMCQEARRNSPSVADCRPSSSCILTTSRIARSSTKRSSTPEILPRANSSRARNSSGGRSRLPTWSARNGGVVRRRPFAGGPREEATAAEIVDRELEQLAGADPGVAAVGGEGDVMGEEGRPEAAYEPRARGTGDVDDCDFLGLGAERDPERPA